MFGAVGRKCEGQSEEKTSVEAVHKRYCGRRMSTGFRVGGWREIDRLGA